jgi:hypothetical protein
VNRHGNALSVNELADELYLSLAAAGRAVEKLVGLSILSRREERTTAGRSSHKRPCCSPVLRRRRSDAVPTRTRRRLLPTVCNGH